MTKEQAKAELMYVHHFYKWVHCQEGMTLTPAQRDLAAMVLVGVLRAPHLRKFVKARKTGVTLVFSLLERFLKSQ